MLRLRNLNPYDRHKLIINEYVLNHPGRTKILERDTSRDKRDIDVVREHHKFLWDEDDTVETWEEQLAKKYYDKLFKEYCISDLSRYKDNKVALRWRIEKEVVSGKGQFICGNKICNEQEELRSWEVNFGYMEGGEKRNALVKLRLCPSCSEKLNYHSKKREVKRMKKQLKKQNKRRKSSQDNDSADDDKGGRIPRPGGSEQQQEQLDVQNEVKVDSEESVDSDNENGSDTEKLYKDKKEKTESDHWNKTIEIEEPTREEEFEKYLEDLLL